MHRAVDIEPARCPDLLLRDPVTDVIDQDLGPGPGNGVQTGILEFRDYGSDLHLVHTSDDVQLGRREAVHVNRVVCLDVVEQARVVVQFQIGIVSALHQNLDRPDRFRLVDLGPDLLVRKNVSLLMAGTPVEGAKRTVCDTDIRVVDVAIHDVRDLALGIHLPGPLSRHGAELEERHLVESGELLQLMAIDRRQVRGCSDGPNRHATTGSRTGL